MTAAQRAQRAGHRTPMDAHRGVLVLVMAMATLVALAPASRAASDTTTTVAAEQSAPILLGVTDALTDPTQDAITVLGPIAAVVLGGTAALDEDVEAHLDALLSAPASDP